MSKPSRKQLDVLAPYLTGGVNGADEQRMRCPIHDDGKEKNPSASVNHDKGVWNCMACHAGGSVGSLVRRLSGGSGRPQEPTSDEVGKAAYDPFVGLTDADVVNLAGWRKAKDQPYVETLTEAYVLKCQSHLMGDEELQEYLIAGRGLTLDTLRVHEVGYDEGRERWVLPVRDSDGALVNMRRYDPSPPEGTPKMKNAAGHGSPPRLYPHGNLNGDTVLVCEGEWDALLSTQHGYPAVTGTHGVMTWLPEWSKQLAGKHVTICFDNDKEGRVGAKQAARSLVLHAASVRIMEVPVEDEHGDISDFWLHGGTEEDWLEFYDTAEHVAKPGEEPEEDLEPETTTVAVIGSMDSRTNGKALRMTVTITGKKDPTYSVPHEADLTCTLDAGPKCKGCVMNTHYEGETRVTIGQRDVKAISRFIDAKDTQVLGLLRDVVGAVPCNRLSHEEVSNHTVEEMFVTGSVDRRRHTEEADYTHRRIYNVGSHNTATNMTATVTGTTVPSHKDRHNEFFAWDLVPAVTSIDQFTVDQTFIDRMSIFRYGKDGPLAKCREIAQDLSANVTGIVGRERLHMAYDLVYHSLIGFTLDGKSISRGWLEFLVVGDTRTGKSETAISMSEHYELGHVVGCEGASFAGLVGGVKQVGDKWTITWGEITINDRRLVVLDEASGLSQEIISQLSDIRSRGEAQLTKVERHQTKARCRLIWISNPRTNKFVDEKRYDGIDVIEGLIGNPEDIARFDFAMSVSASDVRSEDINNPDRAKVPHVYTAELCRELIVWAWSRKPDQVDWKPDAYRKVYEAAEWMGKRYVDHPPLVQRTNVREKIARVAVALAARTFSTDDTGERLVIEKEHVRDAMMFLDQLYSYDNFGYLRLSQRIHRNYRLAAKNRAEMKKWLLTHPRLIEFLLDRRGSFRAQDLEEMAGMMREEASQCINRLSETKMISKTKSQILIEPELNDLLKEIERDRRASK